MNNSSKSPEQIEALRLKWARQFAVRHEGKIVRSGGRVMIMRSGTWTCHNG